MEVCEEQLTNFDKICRTCLSIKTNETLKPLSDNKLHEMLYSLTTIKVITFDLCALVL